MDFYNKELSYIHDRYFTDIAFNASQYILKLLNKDKQKQKTIIDLGCGSGLLAKILTENNYSVIGVDISEQMLEIAKFKAPKAIFINTSLFSFDFPKSDIVCAIGESINYLFDNENNFQLINSLFNKIYNSLLPNGYFIFDILTTDIDKKPTNKIVDNDYMTIFVEPKVNTKISILERKITFFTKHEKFYKKNQEIHKQYLYNRNEVKQMLEKIGFRVVESQKYNEIELREGHFTYFCQT
jgi:SAM-dependent methyltransferase